MTSVTTTLCTFAISFATCALFVALLIPRLLHLRLLDVPNQRSSHVVPTPRGGGLGILIGGLAGLICALGLLPAADRSALLSDRTAVLPLAALLIVAAIGWFEDFRGGLPIGTRLAGQSLAATLALAGLGPIETVPLPPFDHSLGLLAWPLSFLWILGLTNLYNFLDGIDGFAALQGVVAGATLGLLGGQGPLAVLGVSIAGACAGFLLHNWSPARIFMGDIGSLTLGFCFATAPLAASSAGVEQPRLFLAVVLSLWLFLSDGVFTFLRRLAAGEKVWQAHRSHLYQRLTGAGLSHAAVTARVGIAMVATAAAGCLAMNRDDLASPMAALGFALAVFIGYLLAVRRLESSRPSRDEAGSVALEEESKDPVESARQDVSVPNAG